MSPSAPKPINQKPIERGGGVRVNELRPRLEIKEAWTSTHVNLVGGETRRRADRVVACELHLRELQRPVVLTLIDCHSQHLGNSVVHPFNASVTVCMIGACGKFAHSQRVVDSL